MKTLRVRACIKCKEYVPVHEGNFKSRRIIEQFEKDHKGHMLVISLIEEIKEDGFKNITDEIKDKL